MQEPIEWDVLEIQNGKALLLSKYILFTSEFDNDNNYNWENSYLRNRLNDEFLNSAFNKKEQNIIQETEIKSNDISVKDKVFALSEEEFSKYCRNRVTTPTKYAELNNIYDSNDLDNWWLRSISSYNSNENEYVWYGGSVKSQDCYTEIGVRPAIWIEY